MANATAMTSTTEDASKYRSFLQSDGKPLPNREATNAVLDALLQDSWRSSPDDVYGPGPSIVSDVPKDCQSSEQGGVIMGIDEAGRGPLLGPMTYAAAYWNPNVEDSGGKVEEHASIPSGFNDSKQLSPAQRAVLFSRIRCSSRIGFVLRVLHASELSRNMLRKVPYNLNAMSHDAAIGMVRAVIDAGVKIDTWYVRSPTAPSLFLFSHSLT